MILGMTGHQNLEEYDSEWILHAIKNFLSENYISKGLTSLAIGADQLVCNELKNKNIDYEVIIPCVNYESTFKSTADLAEFKALVKNAKKVETLNFTEPSEEAFYSAGIEIVKSSTLIIAIWNGRKAKGLGGTGDIVDAASKINKPVYHINPLTQQCEFLNDD